MARGTALAGWLATAAAAAALSGCAASARPAGISGPSPGAQPSAASVSPSTVPPVTASPSTTHAASPAGPPPLPAFTAAVSGPLSPAAVPYTWRPGCPVPPASLRGIRLTYFGFDGRAHTGLIIVNERVVDAVVSVFRRLYEARFPIRRMVPEDAYRGQDPDSMAADNTSGFNCRYAVAPGAPQWSMHAYGEAIDVNPVENPYLEPGSPVQPPAGAEYTDRADVRPGMAVPRGVLVAAFTDVGWGWGGNWSSGPDYQHFSVNGQ